MSEPSTMKIADQLQARGFRPTRLNKTRTDFAPVAPPARPGFIVASLDRSGLASVPPGMVETCVGPEMAGRIKLAAESVRIAGLPVMVLIVNASPTEENARA